jgi:hypothetical protein
MECDHLVDVQAVLGGQAHGNFPYVGGRASVKVV